jgi:hypothetical protein
MENTAIQEQTAMQQLSEKLNEMFAGDGHGHYDLSDIRESINKLVNKHLPKEREQIEEAWNKGAEQCYDNTTATEYFTTKYKQDEYGT